MFEKGEYIVYGQNGICQVEDITHLDISGADKKKLYYVLCPLSAKTSRIYYPTDRENRNARRLIDVQEANRLLEELPSIGTLSIQTDKMREDAYKQALYSGDCRKWIAMIKTLLQRCREREAAGKRIAALDERYLKLAKDALYGELAFVLERDRAELEQSLTDLLQPEKV